MSQSVACRSRGIKATARISLVALGVVSALALQGCFLLFPVGPNFRVSGLDFDDDFDRIFSRAFGCPIQSSIKRSKELGLKGPGRCTYTSDAFLVLILQKEPGTTAKKYLQSKGGKCTDLSLGAWRCVVVREVTSTGYMGDTPAGPPMRTVFTLKVERQEDGRLLTDIDRDDLHEKQEPPRK